MPNPTPTPITAAKNARGRSTGGSTMRVVEEWWFPIGEWAEIAIYDPRQAADLLHLLTTEVTARRTCSGTEELVPIVVSVDSIEALTTGWQQQPASADHRFPQHAPADTVDSLRPRTDAVEISLLLGETTAPWTPRATDPLPRAEPSSTAIMRTCAAAPARRSLWRTPAAATRVLLAYPTLTPLHQVLLSAHLRGFIEHL